jgi:arylformamidase
MQYGMSTKIFLDYDADELNRQYDQRAWAANAEAVINQYGVDSNAVRVRLGEPQVMAYGASPAETVDIYRPREPDAPIHVFFHGGAWRALSKRESAFAAETFVSAGAHFIAVDFALLPNVTLAEMVAQARRAVAGIHRRAGEFGGDRERLYVSGHSSGAHLAACVLTTDWRAFGFPDRIIKGGLCVSGLYDLLPVRLSARNSYVRLDQDGERALSPLRSLQHLECPVVVAMAEHDSDEFRRQARDFSAAISARSMSVRLVDGRGFNHFEIIETLSRRDGMLGRIALEQMGLDSR